MPADPTYIGKAAPNSLALAEGYPKRTRDGDQWAFTWRYWCPNAKAHDNTGGLIPARNSQMPALEGYDHTKYFLNHVQVSATSVPKMVWVDFKYTTTTSGSGWFSTHSDGDFERTTNKTFREVDAEKAIELGLISRDDISPWQKSVGFVGIEYVYTYYDASFPWTEASVLSYLCEVGTKPVDTATMPGITVVDDYTKWLCKGQSTRDDGGGITQISTTYAWDALAWADFVSYDAIFTTTTPAATTTA